MNPAQQRQLHVQELRKAHFHFGFNTDNNHQSVNQQPLANQKFKSARPTTAINTPASKQPDLQSQHFTLASPSPLNQNNYETIHQSSYKRPASAMERAELSLETKNDLRSHHFKLGFHDSHVNSEYKQKYNQLSNSNVSKQQENSTNTLRKHHHDFGDTNNYYSSMYDTMHNQQYDKSLLGQGRSKQQIIDQIVELRQTNLVMGKDQTDYKTQSHAVHSKPPLQQNFLQHPGKETNLVYGTDTIDYKTQSQAQNALAGQNPQQSVKLNPEQIKDLRVGHETSDYQTMSRNQYKDPLSTQPPKPFNQRLQKTHFDNNKDEVNDYKSIYNQQFSNNVQSKQNLPAENKNKISSIVLGSEQGNERFTSEAAQNFKNHGGQPNQLNRALLDDLRSHHYQFGDDPTQQRTKNKNPNGQPARLDEKLKKDLRSHHFNFGYHKRDFVTHHQEIGSKLGPPNKLDPETLMKIKASPSPI